MEQLTFLHFLKLAEEQSKLGATRLRQPIFPKAITITGELQKPVADRTRNTESK